MQKPPLLQSSLCNHLDAILKPSAPAPRVNKGMTPNMLPSLNGLVLASADPKMADFVGVRIGARITDGLLHREGRFALHYCNIF